MSGDRFHYLFECYKLNLLSGREWLDWQEILQDEQYWPLIISDIDAWMNEILYREHEHAEILRKSWENILGVIGNQSRCDDP